MKWKIILVLFLLCYFISCESELKQEQEKKRERVHPIDSGKPEYKPEQPINFSHKIHAKDIRCEYCHNNPDKLDSIRLKFSEKTDPLLNSGYKHDESLGDISDCNKCHY